MKSFIALCFVLFLPPLFLLSQSPSNFNFNQKQVIPCPFNLENEVRWPVNWMIYQTLDGSWDGTIDSSRCISIEIDEFRAVVNLEQVDPELPIFFRSLSIQNGNIPLIPNALYVADAAFSVFPDQQFQIGTNCPDNVCTGLITGIDIPNEDGTGRSLRFYQEAANDLTDVFSEFCVASEYFEDSFLKEFIIKIQLADPETNGQWLKLFGTGFYNEGFETPFESFSIPASAFDGNSYSGVIESFAEPSNGWDLIFLGLHDETYPTANNFTYIEAQLEENQTTQQEINIEIQDYQALHFQPFTSVRGGLVAGSDTLRHTLNLINNGGDWCFFGLVDIIFEGETHIIYNGGHFDFAGRSSCMMFQAGASLVIEEDQILHYGSWGNGALGLSKGGTVEFRPNSHLVLDGRLVLWDFTRSPANQVYIRLPKGSSLTFDEHATLEKIGFQDGHTKLNIYMDGGKLDDSRLSPEERQLINRIYPEVETAFAKNVRLVQNPVREHLEIRYNSSGKEQIHFQVFTLDGRLVKQYKAAASQGYNFFELRTDELPAALYVLNVSSASAYSSLKFLKQ